MRCALIGVTGQLGHDLARTFELPGELVRLTRADLDLLASGAVGRVLREVRPTHVVNCAAYNLVDRAEDDRDAPSPSTPRPWDRWPRRVRPSAPP
jgi:dTDP-4-dehydrorhamnose reductase